MKKSKTTANVDKKLMHVKIRLKTTKKRSNRGECRTSEEAFERLKV